MEQKETSSWLPLFFFSSILFTFILLKTMKKPSKPSKTSTKKRPPGPWKLPIIGNLHQLIGYLPHRGLRELANKYGPIMSLRLGELSTVVITSAEAAKEVLKTQDSAFADRGYVLAADVIFYGAKDIAFGPHDDYWRRMKKICVTQLLGAKQVGSFRQDREAEVSYLIDRISSCKESRTPVNLSRMLCSLTNCITSRVVFGMLRDQEDSFTPFILKIAQALGGFTLADVFPSVGFVYLITGAKAKLWRLHKEVDAILETIIKEHRERRSKTDKSGPNDQDHKPRDLVDVLLDLQENDTDLEFPLTNDNIKAIILDMFVAGIETSVTTMEWAMSELIKNQRVMKNVQTEVRQVYGHTKHLDETRLHELKYLNLVVRETLRLHSAGPLLGPRENKERAEINGYEIPAKTRIIVNAWAISRDPRYWEEPERFYPERFMNSSIDYKGQDFEYIPFGSGRRMCPGLVYGITVVEFTLASLLYHFDWVLPGGSKPEELDMTETFGIAIRRKHELFLIPVDPLMP